MKIHFVKWQKATIFVMLTFILLIGIIKGYIDPLIVNKSIDQLINILNFFENL